ncbi:MAG: sigma-70 family RNA polymerase sigma factor [Caulobacterales bacterium]|nr:sigma-70 family RNA polymerase sigma factor [Caulobacterales bacterium]
MNVVHLFPSAVSPAVEPPDAPEPAQAEPAAPPEERSPAVARRRAPARAVSPAEILARSAQRGLAPTPNGARLSPAAVIAHALDRPAGLDGFWAVWLAHQEFLRRRSFHLSGGNRADAEDALGNAMLRAAQAYARQPVQNPRAWLLRILHNACMDQHRRNACHAVMVDSTIEPAPAPEAWPRAAPSPEEELSLAQSENAWLQAMRALPGPLNDPLRLHLEGWTDDDIARRLNITRELVRKRRQLAKDRLRRFLAP